MSLYLTGTVWWSMREGDVILRGRAFEEDFLVMDLPVGASKNLPSSQKTKSRVVQKFGKRIERIVVSKFNSRSRKTVTTKSIMPLEPLEEVYRALVLGVHDYVKKNCFAKVLIGISGGIDSALTAVIARDALSSENVIGVLMPSPYTSRESREDAQALARELSIELLRIPIGGLFRSYLRLLEPTFDGKPLDTTEGKPSGPHTWKLVNGPIEQIWLLGFDYGKQKRNECWLCHAVWRYGGRFCRD